MSTPCSGGCVQVSGLAGSEALLFLVVTGATHIPPCWDASQKILGKHWVRQELGSGWYGILKGMTKGSRWGWLKGLVFRVLAWSGALFKDGG